MSTTVKVFSCVMVHDVGIYFHILFGLPVFIIIVAVLFVFNSNGSSNKATSAPSYSPTRESFGSDHTVVPTAIYTQSPAPSLLSSPPSPSPAPSPSPSSLPTSHPSQNAPLSSHPSLTSTQTPSIDFCRPNTDGVHGEPSNVDIVVAFDYEVEITSDGINVLETEIIPAIENAIMADLVPKFFRVACSRRRKMRRSRDGILNTIPLLSSTIIRIRRSLDVVGIERMSSIVDPTEECRAALKGDDNICSLVYGRIRMYASPTDSHDDLEAIQDKALTLISARMQMGAYGSVINEYIVGMSYYYPSKKSIIVGSSSSSASGISTNEHDHGKNDGMSAGYVTLTVILSYFVGVTIIVLLFKHCQRQQKMRDTCCHFCQRRKQQQQQQLQPRPTNNKDISEEIESNVEQKRSFDDGDNDSEEESQSSIKDFQINMGSAFQENDEYNDNDTSMAGGRSIYIKNDKQNDSRIEALYGTAATTDDSRIEALYGTATMTDDSDIFIPDTEVSDIFELTESRFTDYLCDSSMNSSRQSD